MMDFLPDWKWYHIPLIVVAIIWSLLVIGCMRLICKIRGHRETEFLGEVFCTRCDRFIMPHTASSQDNQQTRK